MDSQIEGSISAASGISSPSPNRRSRRKRVHGLSRNQDRLHLIMMLPAVALIVCLIAYPIYLMVDISLHDVKLFQMMNGSWPELTWKNYDRVLSSSKTLRSLKITVIYVSCATALS